MSVGVQTLSRRTKTLRPAQTEHESDGFECIPTEKFIDFKPIILNNLLSPKSSDSDVDKLDKIIEKKYKNYSVTGIRELPLSGGITEDENVDDGSDDTIKVNGESTDVDSSDASISSQLGTKERELQVALQKQERYQSTVQDVTARMERVQQKLVSLGMTPFRNLDQQIAEQKVSS